MKLDNLNVSGFRSIKDCLSVIIDERMTILIGANDHGKSNILSAVRCLNDEIDISQEDRNWDAPDDLVVNIEWSFILNGEELEKLKEYETENKDIDNATLNHVDGSVDELEDSKGDVEDKAGRDFFEVNNENKIIFYRSEFSGGVKVKSVPFNILVQYEQDILKMRPRVELFEAPMNNVVDKITLEDLQKPEFEFMQGVFRLAGVWDERNELFQYNPQNSKRLDEASVKLTNILNKKWNQGKNLIWKLKHTGTNGNEITIEIQDPSISRRYSRPSLRSSGFKTYFLLSMITLARVENMPADSYLFLFDEPGTYLHPHAQLDLQRSFETITDSTQIIYTTHSIFLINKNHPNRNRVVSKCDDGTRIDQKPFIKNWKAVRESLGILLSNNFLIAEKTLLTEGPSDLIYIIGAIKQLKDSGDIDLDLNDLSIVDAGSSENYLSMCKLMLSEGRSVVALLDGDAAGKNIRVQLERVCAAEIKNNELQIVLLPDGLSIEDVMVDMSALVNSIEEAYRYLVDGGLRIAKSGVDITSELAKIKRLKNITLGQTIDSVTKTWFEPEDKISKLSIALIYEDIKDKGINKLALSHINEISDLLDLRGEKSVESGVI